MSQAVYNMPETKLGQQTGPPEFMSVLRKRRQRLFRQIESKTQRVVLGYVSHNRAIDQDDVYHFHHLAEHIRVGNRVTLVLHSLGGDIDAAERLVYLLRESMSPQDHERADLEVVVPNSAKSAATLVALGANRILMSRMSELGPIDPQHSVERDGRRVGYSVFDYVNAYEEAHKHCIEHPENATLRSILSTLDPVIVHAMRQIASRSRQVAEKFLQRYGRCVTYTATAKVLLNTKKFPSHGQMIDWRTAKHELGLQSVEYVDPTSGLWRLYWRLYCELRRVSEGRKIIESRHVSVIT